MNCREFLTLLDNREERELPEISRGGHADSCPRCIFAVRVEEVMDSAPSWAPRPVMSLDHRATVLAKARVRILFWRQSSAMLQDAGILSLVILLLVWLGVTRLPGFLSARLPDGFRESASQWLDPLTKPLGEFFHLFSPLVESPWGIPLIAIAGFFIIMAAILSTQALSPQRA